MRRPGLLALLLNILATVRCVWFYLVRVPSALHESAYENGLERSPFQERALLMPPMRWAHGSPILIHLATRLSNFTGWLPANIEPEGIFEAACDVASIAVAGLVARDLYKSASMRIGLPGLLTPFVYPLTLLMIFATYCTMVSHSVRFVYDLPSLAFFAIALYLLYHRRHTSLFCAIFVVGTMNRETTLLLLPLFLIAWCLSEGGRPGPDDHRCKLQDGLNWPRLFKPQAVTVTILLTLFWMAWHCWINHIYSSNPSAAGPRLLINLVTILCPLAWPQLAGTFAFLAPIVIADRKQIPDALLRTWLYVLPLWAGVMLCSGLWIEIRIFGELIPLIAACAALIAENYLVEKMQQAKSSQPVSAMNRLLTKESG